MTLLRPHLGEAVAAEAPFRLLEIDGTPTGDHRFAPPHLDHAELRALLESMLVTRRLDDEFVRLQRQGQLALYPSCAGQEGAQIGTASALRPTDWIFPQYRELGVFLTRGIDPVGVGHMWRGTVHGGVGFVDRCVAPIAIPIGTQTLHAVGAAMASQRLHDDGVTVAYLGDGATSTGDVHEALNFAAVFDAPCVFVVQNNQWAISTPITAQTRAATLVSKAAGYGMRGLRCDGNDVLASRAVMDVAVEHARRGDGPVLVEAVTYRMGAHTTADDAGRYRDEADVTAWAQRDPIVRLRAHLERMGGWSDDDEAAAVARGNEAAAHLRAGIFDAPEPDPLTAFDHVYASVTPQLREQRGQLASEIDAS